MRGRHQAHGPAALRHLHGDEPAQRAAGGGRHPELRRRRRQGGAGARRRSWRRRGAHPPLRAGAARAKLAMSTRAIGSCVADGDARRGRPRRAILDVDVEPGLGEAHRAPRPASRRSEPCAERDAPQLGHRQLVDPRIPAGDPREVGIVADHGDAVRTSRARRSRGAWRRRQGAQERQQGVLGRVERETAVRDDARERSAQETHAGGAAARARLGGSGATGGRTGAPAPRRRRRPGGANAAPMPLQRLRQLARDDPELVRRDPRPASGASAGTGRRAAGCPGCPRGWRRRPS